MSNILFCVAFVLLLRIGDYLNASAVCKCETGNGTIAYT